MLLVRILALLLGSIVIAKTLTDFKKKEENWRMLLFWVVIWSSVILTAFNPAVISRILLKLSNHSITISQVAGIGFVFVLFIVYRVYIKANCIEHNFSKLIRKIALQDLKKEHKRR